MVGGTRGKEILMKRLIAMTLAVALVAAVVMLAGCPSTGSAAAPSITTVGLAGADGYARVWNSPAKLVKIENSIPTAVTWTTTGGTEVNVPVGHAKMLGSDHMMLEYTYDDQTFDQSAQVATGALSDIASPGNWDRINYHAGKAFYVSNGRLLAVDPSNGSAQEMTQATDNVPSSAHVVIAPSGTPFLFDQSFMHAYPTPETPTDLSGRVSATRFLEALNAGDSTGTGTHNAIYDPAENVFYVINWTGSEYWQTTMNADGSTNETGQTAFANPMASGARRVGSGLPQPDNSVFTDGYNYAVYTVSIVSGTLSLNAIPVDYNAGQWVDKSFYIDGHYYYQTNEAVPRTTMEIRDVDISTGDEVQRVASTTTGLQRWTVTGGVLIWIDDTGSWSMDLATGDVSAYQAHDVQAVTQ